MDILATGLAGIIILTVPLLLWLRLKARAKYKRELTEVRALSAERSELLTELHSRLDTLESESSGLESSMSEEANHLRFITSMLYRDAKKGDALEKYYLALKERNPAQEKYRLIALETKELGAAHEISRRWLEETQVESGWQDTVVGKQSFKDEWRRGNRGPLRGPTLQTS